MKLLKHKSLTILLLFSFFAASCQTDPPENNVSRANQQKFYIHTVKKSETLYSICKKYKVSDDIVRQSNTEDLSVLKIGQKIKIPLLDGINDNEAEVVNSNEFIYHKVKISQTLYYLSKVYNVGIDEILKYNPDAADGIQDGQVIKIPRKRFDSDTFVQKSNDYIIYQIRENETLTEIAQHYGVTVNELLANNISLQNGTKEGEFIKIPRKKNANALAGNTMLRYSIGSSVRYTSLSTPCDRYRYSPSDRFKVAVMLPLYLDENLSLDTAATSGEDKGFYKNSCRMLEFYEGIVMAADTLRKSGMSFDLYVFDTGRDVNKVQKILERPEMKVMDLIIGPVYPQDLEVVAAFAKENEINIVSPLSANEDVVKFNPYVFQVSPSSNSQVLQACLYLIKHNTSKLFILHNGTKAGEDIVRSFKTEFAQASETLGYTDAVLTEVNYKTDKIDGLKLAMQEDAENVIIVPSNDEVFVNKIMNTLNAITGTYNIVLWGMPSWQKFSNLELEYLPKLKMHYYNPFYIDYQNTKVLSFIHKYRVVFKTEPSQYSFQGYDVMNYFMNAMKSYGRNFQYCVDAQELKPFEKGLQSKFRFSRTNNYGGFENVGLYILKYDEELNLQKVE